MVNKIHEKCVSSNVVHIKHQNNDNDRNNCVYN